MIGLNYFLFFGMFGALLPFLSPLLDAMGFSKTQIGWIQAGTAFSATLTPLIVGRIADRFLSVDRMLKVSQVAMMVSAVALFSSQDHPAWFVAVLVLFTISRAPVVPLQDSYAMERSGDNPVGYAKVRVLGSMGFAVSAIITGALIARQQVFILLPLLVVMCAATALSASVLKPIPSVSHRNTASFWNALNSQWWGWLAAMAMHWFCFGPFHYGFTFLLEESGIPRSQHGVIWAVGVLAEITVFLLSGRLFAALNHRQALFLAFAANLVRWAMMGLAPTYGFILVGQLLHGLGFALFYSAALQGIARFSKGVNRASYQSLFSLVLGIAGNCLGMACAGYLHQSMSFSKVLLFMVPVQALSIILLFKFPLIPTPKRAADRVREELNLLQ